MVAAFRSLVLVGVFFPLRSRPAWRNSRHPSAARWSIPMASCSRRNRDGNRAEHRVQPECGHGRDGRLHRADLTPGTYTVTVEMPGFGSVKRTDLLLTAGARWCSTSRCRSRVCRSR